MPDLTALIFKYGLPGLPLSYLLVFYVLFPTSNPEIDRDFQVWMLILLSLLVGYLIQQIWYLIFEMSNWKYNSSRRLVLRYIKERLEKSDELRNKWNVERGNLDGDVLYSIWEAMIYNGNLDKNAIDKLKRQWDYFHANMAIAIGIIFSLLLFGLINTNPAFYAQAIEVGNVRLYVFWTVLTAAPALAVILILKAVKSKRTVDKIEKNWAAWICKCSDEESRVTLNNAETLAEEDPRASESNAAPTGA